MRNLLLGLSVLIGLAAVGMFIAGVWENDVRWGITGYIILMLAVGLGMASSFVKKAQG